MTVDDNSSRIKEQKKTTGINFLDRLNPEDRKLAMANAKKHWDSLTPEQKVEHMSELYAMVREKMRQHGGVMTQQGAIKDFLNNDLSCSVEAAAHEMEHVGYFDIARNLQETRWGVDKFAIEIIDDKSLPRGVLEGA